MKKTLAFLVNDTTRLLRHELDRRIKDMGVTALQWRAMVYINRYPGSIQSHMAEHLEVEPITLSRMVDRLADAGMVRREPCPDDRRAKRLYITEEAEPLINRIRSEAQQLEAKALTGMSEQQTEQLMQLLTQLHHNLGDQPQSTPQSPANVGETAA